ncbi:cytochrome P450 [Streptomyces sp.]|uniref:cytochrome P450 n=1 Tax=Streptomyces sp. TaxID=1931 RepID=UPI002F40811A
MPVLTAPHRLPLLGHAIPLALRRVSYLQSLRDMGDIVQIAIGPHPMYVVNSVEALNQMLVTQGESFDQGRLFENLRPFLGNSVLTCPRSEHRELRRMLQPTFRPQAVSGYARLIADRAAHLVGSYREGDVLDAEHEMHRLTAGVMTKILFAADETADVCEQIQGSLPQLIQGVMRRTMMPAEFLNHIPTPANRRYNQAARDIRAAVQGVIDKYRAEGADRGDMLSELLVASVEGRPLTDEEICDQVVTLLMTGSDTMAGIMCWFFYALTRAPEVERRIADEIHSVLQGRTPTPDDLRNLTHLQHALLETLRLHHPVWFLTRRSITPVTLAGIDFPANTDFGYSPATLHRDPRLFPDPLAFRPERWAQATSDRRAYLPFGAGARKCIGDNLAMTEAGLILTIILQRWSLAPAEQRDVKPVAHAVIHPDRLLVRLSARKPSLTGAAAPGA